MAIKTSGKKLRKEADRNGMTSKGSEKDGRASGILRNADDNTPKDLSWSAVKSFFITSSVALAVYLPTVPPTVVGGDTGELLAEACNLGIAHPPGYPLYTILAYLAMELGQRVDGTHSPAYYANCLSCVLGAAASGVLAAGVALYVEIAPLHFEVGKKQLQPSPSVLFRETIASTVGLLHAFSPLTWQYSVTAEVFALHNLFVALLLYLTVRFAYRRNHSMLLIGAFVCGLSLTNQHTSVLLETPIILWVIMEAELLKEPQKLAQVAASFLMGLSVYLYLPISAHWFPHRGAWGDLKSITGFFDHLRRKNYGSFQLYSGDVDGDEEMFDRTLAWLVDFVGVQTANPLVVLLFLYGFWSLGSAFLGEGTGLARKPQPNAISRAGLVILVALLLYVVVFFSISNLPMSRHLYLGILKRFWLHPNVLSFWVMGVGAYRFTLTFVKNRATRRSLALLTMSASVVFAYWLNRVEGARQIDNYVMRNYATAALESLPENALLFTTGDVDFTSFRYFQECEDLRPDVMTASLSTMGASWWKTRVDLYAPLDFPGTNLVPENHRQRLHGGFTLSQLIDANYDTFDGKVFVSFTPSNPDSRYTEEYVESNHGILAKIKRKSEIEDVTAEQYRNETLAVWRTIVTHMLADVRDEDKYHPESFELKTRSHFFMRLLHRATTLLDLAARPDAPEKGPTLISLLEAISFIEVALTYHRPTQEDPTMMKNLGIAYLQISRNSEEAFQSHLPELEDIFGGDGKGEWWSEQFAVSNWRDWAKIRWHKSFGSFLQMPGANLDPEYAAILKSYQDAMPKE